MGELPGEPLGLEPGAAYQMCLRQLQQPHPDWQAVQALATLSLEETLRGVGAQLADLSHQIMLASRR